MLCPMYIYIVLLNSIEGAAWEIGLKIISLILQSTDCKTQQKQYNRNLVPVHLVKTLQQQKAQKNPQKTLLFQMLNFN